MTSPPPSYHGYRFPPEIIGQAVPVQPSATMSAVNGARLA